MHCICRLRTLLESGLCPSINLRVAYSAIMLAGCGPFYILYILLPGYTFSYAVNSTFSSVHLLYMTHRLEDHCILVHKLYSSLQHGRA